MEVQRAFITDVRLELIPREVTDNKPAYWLPKLTVANSGATPTRGLEYVVTFVHTPDTAGDPGDLFTLKPKHLRLERGRLTIGPHSTTEISLDPLLAFASQGSKEGEQTEWF